MKIQIQKGTFINKFKFREGTFRKRNFKFREGTARGHLLKGFKFCEGTFIKRNFKFARGHLLKGISARGRL